MVGILSSLSQTSHLRYGPEKDMRNIVRKENNAHNSSLRVLSTLLKRQNDRCLFKWDDTAKTPGIGGVAVSLSELHAVVIAGRRREASIHICRRGSGCCL